MASPLKLRRIDCADPKAAKQLADLRRLFCSRSEVLTPKARELSKRVFGESLPPSRAVARICAAVQAKGLAAVLHYTEQFDKVKLDPTSFRVPAEEIQAAHAKADPEFLETIRNIRQNVIAFQRGLLHPDAVLTVSGSHELQLRYRP